jgi:Flp pilus assembly protein TadG
MSSAARRSRRGQSMVEFALILLPFVILLVGILDVGRGIYAYNTVNNAAREAARLGIVDQSVADIEGEARAQAVSLPASLVTVDVDFFLTSGGPGTACPNLGSDTVVYCSVHVTVDYDYSAITPLIGNLIGPVTMTGESQFQVESNCATAGASCPMGN